MAATQSSLTDLLPALHALSRADKLLAIQQLAVDLVREEHKLSLEPGASYPVWTPLNAHEAAGTLEKLLNAEVTATW